MRDARRTSRQLGTLAALTLMSLAALALPALAASVTNIRIGKHPGHVRVVLDLDAPITFQPAGGASLLLKGLSGGAAVLNAGPGDAPLERVELKPQGKDTLLSFKAKSPLTAKAFTLAPGADGGNRLVVDLFAKTPAHQAARASVAPPAPAMETTAEKDGPAVPPLATKAPQPSAQTTAANAPASAPPAPASAVTSKPPAKPTPEAAASAPPPKQTAKAAPAPPPVSEPEAKSVAASEQPAPTPPSEATSPPPATETTAATPPTENAIAPMPSLPASTSTVAPRRASTVDTGAALAAERALDAGDAGTACAEASQVLKNNPSDMRALVVLGGCKLKLGDALAARAAYASAIKLDGSFDRARIGMAEAEAKLGNTAAAQAQYERVLGTNLPTDDVYKVIAAMRALDKPKPAQHASEPTS